MNFSALRNARLFFDTYLPRAAGERVVEIGAEDVGGSIRWAAPGNVAFVAVDFQPGRGSDVVLEDPYRLPLATRSVDVCVSSSVFEHSEMFWLLFMEIIRTLKPGGLFYLNVPTNGAYERRPVDCWRFYPDSGKALVKWAAYCGVSVALLESFVSAQARDVRNDCVAVFVKDAATAHRHPRRMLDRKADFANGHVFGARGVRNYQSRSEDMRRIAALSAELGRPLPSFADPWRGHDPRRPSGTA